jgi:hypothetical protein
MGLRLCIPAAPTWFSMRFPGDVSRTYSTSSIYPGRWGLLENIRKYFTPQCSTSFLDQIPSSFVEHLNKLINRSFSSPHQDLRGSNNSSDNSKLVLYFSSIFLSNPRAIHQSTSQCQMSLAMALPFLPLRGMFTLAHGQEASLTPHTGPSTTHLTTISFLIFDPQHGFMKFGFPTTTVMSALAWAR